MMTKKIEIIKENRNSLQNYMKGGGGREGVAFFMATVVWKGGKVLN